MNYDQAAAYWTEQDKNAVHMPEHELRTAIEIFIKERTTCALAAADGDFVRCTPLSYKYRARKFLIFSEGGLKFRALKENKHVSLAVFDEYKGPGSANGLQVTGTAAVIGADDPDYISRLEELGINAAHMQKLGLTLILITPHTLEYLDSALRERGYSPRQSLKTS
jgi:hypothetical protein